MPGKKPIIAFDFDDVLVEVTRNFLRFYNKEFIVDYEKIEKDIASLIKITEEDELRLWDKFFASNEYLSIAPTIQQRETLVKIKDKFNLVILTNRSERFRKSLIKWVERHLPGYFSEVLFCADFPKGRQTKGFICSELKIKMLIDDEPKNIISCLEYNVPVTIYDCPWNKKLDKGLQRISSLKDIRKILML